LEAGKEKKSFNVTEIGKDLAALCVHEKEEDCKVFKEKLH